MNIAYQRFGVWSGVGFFFLFWLACITLSGFVPPPAPTLSGQDLLTLYRGHFFGIRFAMMVAYLAALLLVPWTAVISIQMARIEGRYPMMSLIAFGAGIANAVAFYMPFIFWSAAFYRAGRSPDLVQLFSDTAWLEFVMLYAPFAMQTAAIAVVGLSDKGPAPTFPRWFCYLSIWVAIATIPGGFADFFQGGPFAWNGLIAFWIPVTVFCVYFAALVPLLFKAIKRQEIEERTKV
jgi:hypothetical protein